MKIALVHELLTMRGGAERVLKILADMFPYAPIYTLLYDESKLGDWFPKERIRTSNLQPATCNFSSKAFNHHLYLRKFPAAVEAWDFSDFELVISTSSAFAHGIITNSKPKHISVVNSPARYLWDQTQNVLDRASKGLLGPLKRKYLESTFHRLRTWDAEAADRPDMLLTASKEVQRRIELYWRRESEVVYPPVDDFWLEDKRSAVSSQRSAKESYFLIVSTLVPYKRIELAIEACNRTKVPLKIAGEGPARKSLEKLAGPTIEFLGYQSNEQLKNLYSNAIATIFPGDEDFGLVPLESMACGTPVIAYRKGGALETIIEGETGMFFDEPTADSLKHVIESFDRSHHQSDKCQSRAKEFSREKFEHQIRTAIEDLQR